MMRIDQCFGLAGIDFESLPENGSQVRGLVKNISSNFQDETDQVIGSISALKLKSDVQIKNLARTASLSQSTLDGRELPNCLAGICEASRRVLGLEPYPVQILAGIGLIHGCLAEISTGEGKTLIASMPAIFNGLQGKRVHVSTVNDYLAQRDRSWLQPLYKFFGLSTALVGKDDTVEQKHNFYSADIVYGAGYQFGFDYLREQIQLIKEYQLEQNQIGLKVVRQLAGKQTAPNPAHRIPDLLIVDEVDSVLLDEALTPLIISTSKKTASGNPRPYEVARKCIQLLEQEDYSIELNKRTILLNRSGRFKAEAFRNEIRELNLKRPWLDYVEQALRARFLFFQNVHYIISEKKIIIIDEFTGRPHEERSWQNGLHQAIECKESVTITEETESSARITRQSYVKLHNSVCGMSGTIQESVGELRKTYGFPYIRIPTHHPSQQIELPPVFCADAQSKRSSVIACIEKRHLSGQPVLVGTRTVQSSEQLAADLSELGLQHLLLNARQDKQEAEIIGTAGTAGTITIATNMAGRGAHIQLDEQAARMGGLHVIVYEVHESSRIDRQLIGRSGRQGQPGSAQKWICPEDDLIVKFAPALARELKKQSYPLDSKISNKFYKRVVMLQNKIDILRQKQRFSMMLRDKWLEEFKSKL